MCEAVQNRQSAPAASHNVNPLTQPSPPLARSLVKLSKLDGPARSLLAGPSVIYPEWYGSVPIECHGIDQNELCATRYGSRFSKAVLGCPGVCRDLSSELTPNLSAECAAQTT